MLIINNFFLRKLLGILCVFLLIDFFFVYFSNSATLTIEIKEPTDYTNVVASNSATIVNDSESECPSNPGTTVSVTCDDFSYGSSCCQKEGDYKVWAYSSEGEHAPNSGNFIEYSVNWDATEANCTCKVGSGHWDSGASKCCGDDGVNTEDWDVDNYAGATKCCLNGNLISSNTVSNNYLCYDAHIYRCGGTDTTGNVDTEKSDCNKVGSYYCDLDNNKWITKIPTDCSGCSKGSDCDSGLCIEGTCRSACSDTYDGKRCSDDNTNSYTADGICTRTSSGWICDETEASYDGSDYWSDCSLTSYGEECDSNSLSGGYSKNGVCGASNHDTCCTDFGADDDNSNAPSVCGTESSVCDGHNGWYCDDIDDGSWDAGDTAGTNKFRCDDTDNTCISCDSHHVEQTDAPNPELDGDGKCESACGASTQCDEKDPNKCYDLADETTSWTQSDVADEKCDSNCIYSSCDPTCCSNAAATATVENGESCSASKCSGTCSNGNCLVRINTGYVDCDSDAVCVSGKCYQSGNGQSLSACDTTTGAICDTDDDADMCVPSGACARDKDYDGNLEYGDGYVLSGDTSWDVDNDGDKDYCDNGVWKDCKNDNQCKSGYYCNNNDCVVCTAADCADHPNCRDGTAGCCDEDSDCHLAGDDFCQYYNSGDENAKDDPADDSNSQSNSVQLAKQYRCAPAKYLNRGTEASTTDGINLNTAYSRTQTYTSDVNWWQFKGDGMVTAETSYTPSDTDLCFIYNYDPCTLSSTSRVAIRNADGNRYDLGKITQGLSISSGCSSNWIWIDLSPYLGSSSGKMQIVLFSGDSDYIREWQFGWKKKAEGAFSDSTNNYWCCDDSTDCVYNAPAQGNRVAGDPDSTSSGCYNTGSFVNTGGGDGSDLEECRNGVWYAQDDDQTACQDGGHTWLSYGTGDYSKCCGDDGSLDSFEQTSGSGRSCCLFGSILGDGSVSGSFLCHDGQLYSCNNASAFDFDTDYTTSTCTSVEGYYCNDDGWKTTIPNGCSGCSKGSDCTSNLCVNGYCRSSCNGYDIQPASQGSDSAYTTYDHVCADYDNEDGIETYLPGLNASYPYFKDEGHTINKDGWIDYSDNAYICDYFQTKTGSATITTPSFYCRGPSGQNEDLSTTTDYSATTSSTTELCLHTNFGSGYGQYYCWPGAHDDSGNDCCYDIGSSGAQSTTARRSNINVDDISLSCSVSCSADKLTVSFTSSHQNNDNSNTIAHKGCYSNSNCESASSNTCGLTTSSSCSIDVTVSEGTHVYGYARDNTYTWIDTDSSVDCGSIPDLDTSECWCNAGGYTDRWALGGDAPNGENACCGDDTNEYKIKCVGDVGACTGATDNSACCDANTDCVYDNTCYTNGTERGDYKCDNGYWRHLNSYCGVVLNGNRWNVTTRTGVTILAIDQDGDAVFFCKTMHKNTLPPASLTNSLIVNVSGTFYYALNTNDCYVKGSILDKTTVPAEDGGDLVIKSSGTRVASFNSDSNIYIKGVAAYDGAQANCASGYVCDASTMECKS